MEWQQILNKKIKVVYKEGDNLKIVRGILLDKDDTFIYIGVSNTPSIIIALNSIDAIKEIGGVNYG